MTQAEFLALRRKAFAKLDTDKDGVLSFEEAAAKTIANFTGADADHDGKLTAGEFQATSSMRRSGDEGA
ncbi:hypothetical protein EUV02_11260 [Polymorphobacter arshaanensis]|uniref:EF-hand domain-containing protein n=1 Tax=Glacieibacterium arshaanense TaxID=2511025 RepID=A0A4Y9ENR9_9SPHN|nr:hypothetical protein [Polymorphobacter arshaanensis]TFU03716.1 hypothetical protein EUV02_11260 [Polymorphobacter arshaanensis]